MLNHEISNFGSLLARTVMPDVHSDTDKYPRDNMLSRGLIQRGLILALGTFVVHGRDPLHFVNIVPKCLTTTCL